MTRAFGGRALWWLVLALVIAACGSGDEGERLGQARSAVNAGQSLVIRQIYPRPGTYSRAFVEIYNRGTAPASLAGLSLQAPIENGSLSLWSVLRMLPSVWLKPGQSFLVASAPLTNGPDLPVVADAFQSGPPWSSGFTSPGSRAALVQGGDLAAGTVQLHCYTTRPCTIDPADVPRIVDLVGFGGGGLPSSNLPSEGTSAPYPSSTQALLRKANGTQDTDSNLNDFQLGAPEPRNMDSYVTVPVAGAPVLDATTGTTPGGLSSFIYDSTNPNAPQTGVTAGAIDPALAGWVVGYVKDGNGAANAGVTVSVVGQGKYGHSTTRADGRFDLVVNGSANFTLRFEKTGFFAADRRVYVGAQLTASVEDVWLVAADSNAKVVSASSPNFQVATGSLVAADADSASRTAVLMIPPQTKFRNGNTELSSMTLRLTEYTAGPNGINRMPASLTGSPAYTYAVEISADEAPGQSIDFVKNVAGNPAQQAFFYVNDLVGFPVGSSVPTGYYDRNQGAWIRSTSGTVIQVVVTNGVATVDVNGGGVDSTAVVDAFGIKPEELAALATQYGKSGQTTTTQLWRVPITHMTPYDCNWPTVPPPCEGVCPGPQGSPPPPGLPGCSGCCKGPGGRGGADGDTPRAGSIIGCDSGVLGETVNVAGTSFSLNYSSYNAPGYAAKRQIKIGLTDGSALHTAEKVITVDVMVAGQTHHREFTPAQNLSWTFQWDGLDAAGRPVVGTAIASVKIRSVFLSRYALVAGFGDLPPDSPILKSSQRAFVSYDRSFQVPLMGQVPRGGWSLGDWTLSPHHFYDVLGNTVHLGSGGRLPSALQTSVISRIMGDGQSSAFAPDGTSANAPNYGFDISRHPEGTGAVVAAPNGDVFMVDKSNNRVRRIDSAGKIYTVAGSGTPACQQNVFTAPNFANSTNASIADGTADATLANITEPSSLAVGSDGSLYIGTTWERTVRKATPLGNGKYSISTFAGGSALCSATVASTVDNVPATSATFKSITALAVGPDGSVYVADADAYRVRRIDPAGLISTIAGNGSSGGPARADEGKLASSVSIFNVSDIAVGPDGTLYVAQPYNLLSIDKNGKLHFLNRAWDVSTTLADGVLLSEQAIDIDLESVAVTPSGTLIYNDNEWQRIHPSGNNSRAWIRTVAPSGIVTGLAATPDVPNSTGQTTPASGLALRDAPPIARGLAAAPNGDVLLMTNNSIYRISPAHLPDTTSCADQSVRYLVPSGDSGFCFDGNGRHKKTIDLHTGQALYAFGYYPDGVLKTITDPGGRITNIVPTATGFVISAPAPGDVNQKTTVTVVNGHTTNIADAIGSFKPSADATGLLFQLLDGENNTFSFTYDIDGYLSTDKSPLGTQKLTRSSITGGKTVTLTSPLGRKTVFDTVLDPNNKLTHTTTFPDLTVEKKIKTPDGVDQLIDPDGTTTAATTVVVPQLGGQTALPAKTTVKLPSGLTMTTLRTLSDPASGPRVAKVMYDGAASPPIETETTTTTFSATGKTIVTASPEGRTTTVKTDGTGHVTQRLVGTLTPTDFTYISGQLATAVQGARSTTYTYVTSSTAVDAGYLLQIQGPASTTEIRRNLRGLPLSIETALGTTVASKTNYTWFNTDLLKTVRTPELGADHTFAYNAVKQIQQYLPPPVSGVAAPETNYTYTNDRDLFTEQPPQRSAITRAYLATTGQLDTITLPATSLLTLAGTIDYDYFNTTDISTGAAAGRVSSITGPTAGDVLTYRYDGALRTSQKWTGSLAAEVQWFYNNRFLPKQEKLISTSAFDRFFGYDKDGLLVCNSPTTCNPAGTDALNITRSTIHGGVTLIDQGGTSGARETWTYSDTDADRAATPKPMAYGELREQSATVGGTAASNVVADLVYDAAGSSVSERRDNLGRIRFKTETFRDATAPHASVTKKFEYIYDERGQLKSVYLGGALTGTLIYDATYDKNGNRKTFKTASAGPVTTCIVDAGQDQLTSCGTKSFTYYANGEVKTKTGPVDSWTYHYDALSRLRQVMYNGGTAAEYVLDGEGRRIAKTRGGQVIKRWVYGTGLSPIAELDGAGALVARYIYGSRQNTPDLVIRDGKTYRLISDQLGSPRYAVNVADKDDVPYQVSYSPLGVPAVAGGLAPITIDWIPFGFAGGMYDYQTGLVHFGARDYDPETGRWLTKDPIRFDGGQANLYVYVGNDPINSADATGLSACSLGILGVVVSCGGAGAEIAGALAASAPTGGLALAASIGGIAVQSFSCAAAIDSAADACRTPPTPPPAPSCGSH